MFSSLDTQYVILGGGIAVALAAVLGAHILSRNRARYVVRVRSPLSPAKFSGLFATDAEAALGPLVRDCLRGYIPVDPALVLPDDRLCEDGIDANEFLIRVERFAGVKIPDREAQRMFTLRDIVSYLAARRYERPT